MGTKRQERTHIPTRSLAQNIPPYILKIQKEQATQARARRQMRAHTENEHERAVVVFPSRLTEIP